MPDEIILGISGGIAAYKSPELVRLMVKQGLEVHCILTEQALQFVTPMTLLTLSGHPVLVGRAESSESGKIEHIDLAEKAALIVIAPATANVVGKLAYGIADDLLTTTLLAAQGTVLLCPAMNVYMWESPATQDNVRLLLNRGIEILGPASGGLACGYEGYGRMEEPETILKNVELLLKKKEVWRDKQVLITAGPTREYIDPVRFISNPSTGKMGYALARAAIRYGAQVTLVSGPTELVPPYGAKVINVTTAQEMLVAVEQNFLAADVFISAAAVSDQRPQHTFEQKVKKENASSMIELEPTEDILASIVKRKKNQLVIGFAAETESLREHAEQKLHKKKLDLIVGNLVSSHGHSAFGSSENEITLFYPSGKVTQFPRITKTKASYLVLDAIGELFRA